MRACSQAVCASLWALTCSVSCRSAAASASCAACRACARTAGSSALRHNGQSPSGTGRTVRSARHTGQGEHGWGPWARWSVRCCTCCCRRPGVCSPSATARLHRSSTCSASRTRRRSGSACAVAARIRPLNFSRRCSAAHSSSCERASSVSRSGELPVGARSETAAPQPTGDPAGRPQRDGPVRAGHQKVQDRYTEAAQGLAELGVGAGPPQPEPVAGLREAHREVQVAVAPGAAPRAVPWGRAPSRSASPRRFRRSVRAPTSPRRRSRSRRSAPATTRPAASR